MITDTHTFTPTVTLSLSQYEDLKRKSEQLRDIELLFIEGKFVTNFDSGLQWQVADEKALTDYMLKIFDIKPAWNEKTQYQRLEGAPKVK